MNLLITGASGFIGQILVEKLVAKGNHIYALSRHPIAGEGITPLAGDITEVNLGLKSAPRDIDAVYHLAAIHRLGVDKDGAIWHTNVDGTKRVLAFCALHNIPRLYFCSTAYTEGRNTYEASKALCETMVQESDIPHKTIFKPSVVMGTAEHPYPGHFSQFVGLVIKVHQRAELVRRKIEGTLRLPVIEPVFRVKGNPGGKLNLIPVDDVASAMASIEGPGVFWLTNPSPPSLDQLTQWIGEFIMVKFEILSDFKPTPIEVLFQNLGAAFQPYLLGDDLPSDITCKPITKEFIHDTIKRTILD